MVKIWHYIKRINFGSVIAKLVAAVMLFEAVDRHPYDYYRLVRWITCGIALFIAYQALAARKIGWLILIAGVACIFNPFVPLHFKRETWEYADMAAAVLLLLSVPIMDFRKSPPKDG